VHKEAKWLNEVKDVEMLFSPHTPLRPAVTELLKAHVNNVITADGDKYLGVALLPKIAATIALWRERETPIYKVLMEPIKRVESYVPPLTAETSDKEVREILAKHPLVDEYPAVEDHKVAAILPVRELIVKYTPNAPQIMIKELAEEIPTVGSVGEALMIMEEKELPVVAVEDKVLDARKVLERVWEMRRYTVAHLQFDDLLEEPQAVKATVSLKEVLENIDPMKVDYILVDDEGKLKYVPLGVIASKVF
jgi:CBS domain-containing protein